MQITYFDKKNDFINKKYGRLTIKDLIKENQKTYAIADCDCGNKNIKIIFASISNGITKSCGCLRKENVRTLINYRKKNFGVCSHCGEPKLFAKNLCRNCYHRQARNNGIVTLSRKEKELLKKSIVKPPKFSSCIEKKRNDFIDQYKDVKLHTLKQKIIFDLYTKEKLTITQIAKKLGITKQAVYDRITKIKRLKNRNYKNFIINN